MALLVETSHEFGRAVLRGVQEYDRTLDEHWAFYLQPDGTRQVMPDLKAWHCTGVIARPFSVSTAAWLLGEKLPLVLVDPHTVDVRDEFDFSPFPHITTDAESIAALAFDHLRACGCVEFAFVHSVEPTVWSERRGEAFQRLVEKGGLTCHVYATPPQGRPWDEDIGHLGRWLLRLPRGLGVFAARDQRGHHVVEACREAGLHVPDDVVVLGVDNDPLLSQLCEPSLSSVALDVRRAGFEAAQVLDRMMGGEHFAPGTRILVRPTHVSRRRSTSSSFGDDRVVTLARRYIFEHFAEPDFQVSGIAAHCGVSRRLLETRFVQTFGKTPLQMLIEMRMERARTLLLETTDPVHTIAVTCGFADANYFTKAFRRTHGKAPQSYRESAQLS